ncbi:hypothetical protein CK203_089450 [Vitis vinifera]|uniref:DUF4283 domain-containing protein n=1 Tax=Vitis vinifera TaxID=29760 RepID=A0A438E8W6_VITVI|nr:hypothetical protein CK203_089450 [Vitis vinifera]
MYKKYKENGKDVEGLYGEEDLLWLGFEKEEVGWLIEHLMKAMEMKNAHGFQTEIKRKTRVHLMEVCFNNHGRFIRLSRVRFQEKVNFSGTSEENNGAVRDGDRDRLANVETVRSLQGKGESCHEGTVSSLSFDRGVRWGMEFTISVVVVGEEDIRRGREMGESTRQEFEPHSWIGGRKRVEEASSTAVDGEVWAGGDKAQSTGEKGLRVSKQVRRAHSSLKPKPQIEVDLGWKRGDSLKGPFPKMGQELGGKQPSFAKGSLRRDDPFAKGKEKVGSEVSEAQLRGSMLKCGSKKLWNVLFPPSFGCDKGVETEASL